MSLRDEIETTLTREFAPTSLEVIDDSERHIGHAGYKQGGNTHFRIIITAPFFDNLSRVAQHRAINDALKAQFDAGIHALNIKIIKSA